MINPEVQNNYRPYGAPLPINSALAPVALLTPDMIPESLRAWLTDNADRMKCPIDFVAATTVVMVSSLIGTRLVIKPKRKDSWVVVPNLWGGIIGDPSSRKTPSISEVFKPLNQIIAKAQEQFNKELLHHEESQLTYELQKKLFASQELNRLKGKYEASPVNFPEMPKMPTERRFLTNDPTVEKLGELLNENPKGLLVFRDELIGLLAGWERPGRDQDRAFFLEAWNGSGSMTIDRIGRGKINVNNLCISLFGGIQPSKLLRYLQAATGYENDGFVQRLQVAVYPDKAPWDYVDETPDKLARDNAYEILLKIVDSDLSELGFPADDHEKFPYIHFNDEAQVLFKDWLIHWETQVLPQHNGLLLEHFTKYSSLMPSLALIFHVIDHAGGILNRNGGEKGFVSKQAAETAIKWCNYLSSHAMRIYGLLDTMHLSAAKVLSRHLMIGNLKDGFKLRDIQRKGWSQLTTHEQVQSALEVLVDLDWIRPWETELKQTGRPEGPGYWINPTIKKNV